MNSVVGHSSLVVGKTDAPSDIKPVSGVVRCIVAVTAWVTAGMGIPILLPVIVSVVSIAGVLLARRFPRRARHLMWFGAAVTTLWALPFGVGILRISVTGGTDPKVIMAVVASIVLVIACDVALITDGFGQRPTTNDQGRS